MNANYNELLGEIVHLASGAMLAEDGAVKRQAMADIIDALAGVIPAERSALGSAPTVVGRDVLTAERSETAEGRAPQSDSSDGRGRSPSAPQCLAKFLTVKEGVTLVRFKGDGVTRLVARRIGQQGNPNTIFEIIVSHRCDYAKVFRDDRELFSIRGDSVGHNIVEKLAVSALHRYLKDQRPAKSKRRRAAKLRAGILTPEAELSETVARQREMDEPTAND